MATPTPNIVGDTTADNFGTSQTNPDPTAGWANQAAARAVRGGNSGNWNISTPNTGNAYANNVYANIGNSSQDTTTPLTSSYSNTGSVPISRPNGSGTMSVPTNNASQAPTENTPQATSGTTAPTNPPAPTIPSTPPTPKISLPQPATLPQPTITQVGNGASTSIPIPNTTVPVNPSAIPGYDQMTQQQKTQAINPSSTPYTTPPATPLSNVVTPEQRYQNDLTSTQGNIDTLSAQYNQELLQAQQQGDIEKATKARQMLDYINTQRTNATNANQTAVTAENLRNQSSVQQIQEVQRRVQEQGISLNQQQRQAELGMRQTAAAIDRTQGAQGGASASIQGAIIAGQNASALSNDINTELAIHAQRVAGYNAQMTTSDQQHANAIEQLHNSLTSTFDDLNYKLNSALTTTQQQAISKMETAQSDVASGKMTMEDFSKMMNGDGTEANPGLYTEMGNSVSELYGRYAATTKAMVDGAQAKFNDLLDVNKQAQTQQSLDLENQKFQAEQNKFDPTLSNATGVITSVNGQPMLAPNGNPYTFNKEAGDIVNTFQDPQTGAMMANVRDKATGNMSTISLQSSYTPQKGDIQGAIKNMQSGNADTIKNTLTRMKDQNWSPDAQNQVMQSLPSDIQQKVKEQQALDQTKVQSEQQAKDTLAQINSTDPTQRDTGFLSLGQDFMNTIADEAKTAGIPLPNDINSFTFAKNLSDNYRSNGGDLAGAYTQTLKDMSDSSTNDSGFFANLAKVTGIKIATLSADLASKTMATQVAASNAGLSTAGTVGTQGTNGQMTDMTSTLNRPQGSTNIGQDTNNPTNIMAENPTEIAYAQSLGAVGTYTSPNGRTYAVFPDMATGKSAGLQDITSKLNGGSSWVTPDTTVAQFASGWTSGPNAPIDQAAVKAYSDYLGVSPDTKISSINPSKLEDAVIAHEGVDPTKNATVPQSAQTAGGIIPDDWTRTSEGPGSNGGNIVNGTKITADTVWEEAQKVALGLKSSYDSVGMGNNAIRNSEKNAIQNKANQLIDDSHVNPGELASSYKSAGQALTNMYKQSANVDAFSEQALKNMELVRSAIKGLNNTDFKDINSLVNAIKAKGGDPSAVAAMDTALYSFTNEYAKIASGSVGSVAHIPEGSLQSMQALLNANMSPEAMDTSLGNMETEINNRVSTLHDSVADVSKGKNLQPLADFYKFVAEKEIGGQGSATTPTQPDTSSTSSTPTPAQQQDLSAYHSALNAVLKAHGL